MPKWIIPEEYTVNSREKYTKEGYTKEEYTIEECTKRNTQQEYTKVNTPCT